MFIKFILYVSFSLVAGCTSALAQNANDIMNMFGGMMQSAIMQATQTEWNKLSQSELSCVDQALRQRGTDLRTAIRQGITPSDTRVADARSTCRQTTAQTPSSTVTDNQASQTQEILWDHNGSTVYLVSQGRSRRFFYKEPRPGMRSAGAKPGSLIFEGEAIGQQYDGTAYLFDSRCGPLPYRVSGPILDNYRRVELRGRAPRVDNNCRITAQVDDVLGFQLIEPTVQLPQIAEAPSSNTLPQQPNVSPFPRSPDDTRGNAKPSIFPTAPTDSSVTPKLRVPVAAQADSTRTVEVTGIAETPDAARKDAARQAVQQVAGVFIDNRRRVETDMSDQKLSEIVEEKILSYTNAYVTKLEVLSTEHRSEGYVIKAKVTVEIAPLLKTLQTNNVPTVAFDTDSGAVTAETQGDEKRNALAIYSDLVARVDGLVKIGLGKGEVSPSIPSAADSARVSVPVTFFVTADGLQEWKKQFERISDKDKRARVSFGVTQSKFNNLNSGCATFPTLHFSEVIFPQGPQTFLSQRPGSGQFGVAACFLTPSGPTSFIADCFGRAFVTPTPGGNCTPGSDCFSLRVSTSSIRITVEFLDKV